MPMKTSLLGISLLLVLVLSLAAQAQETRRDFLIYYDDPNWPGGADHVAVNEAQRADIAARYELGVGQSTIAADAVRELRPDFGWFVYNSFQDNYVAVQGMDEHNWLMSQAAAAGVDPEVFYMHYYDDTRISLQGQTIFIPGWGGGSASTKAEARLPVYYSNKSRIMCNYSDPTARQFYKEYMVQKLQQHPDDGYSVSSGYWTGIFWDNCQPELYNTGSVVSGGHVLEHPTRARIDSLGSSRLDWWYQSNMKPFMQELMDTLLMGDTWMPNNRDIGNMLNTAGNTRSELATDQVCTHLFQEFSPSVMRHSDSYFRTFSSHDVLCAANGVNVCYSPSGATTVSSGSGSYTREEMIHSNCCWFYVSSTDSSMFYQQTTNGPSTDRWDSVSWCGSMDYDVGEPVEAYSTAQSGTDPEGYSYTVYKRPFARAVVYIRPRGSWNENIDAGTAVTVDLGGTYRELFPDGSTGSPVTSISIRNAQGKIVVPASGDLTPPEDVIDLDVEPADSIGQVGMNWTEPADDGSDPASGPVDHYVIKYYANPIDGSNWAYAREYPVRPDGVTPGATRSFTMTGLPAGEFNYYAVRAYDENGNQSGVSNSPSAFVTGLKVPGGLAALVDLELRTARLSCTPVASYYDGVEYEFSLTDSAAGSVRVLSTADTTGSRATVLFSDLDETATYLWQCRAVAVGQASSLWSDEHKFRLSNIVPDPPVAQFPASGDTVLASRESFTLSVTNGFDPDGPGTLRYDFELRDVATQTMQASVTDVIETNSQTSWRPQVDLNNNTAYEWRSRCHDGVDYSAWMLWTEFLMASLGTGTETPAAFEIVAYPNPVHFAQGEYVTFTLPNEPVDILIQSVSGETVLVRKGVSSEWQWLGQNASGNVVSVGVYSWFVRGTNQSGKILVKP